MKKIIFSGLLALIVVGSIVVIVRFGVRTAEDNWTCTNGQWSKHGNPRTPLPDEPCEPIKEPSAQESVLPAPPKDLPVEMDFFSNGELIRNRPDLATADWYLTFTRMGYTPVTVKMVFDQASRCQLNGEAVSCLDLGPEDVMPARVEGYQREPGSVLVRNLTTPFPPK